jgi:hypothetical protein
LIVLNPSLSQLAALSEFCILAKLAIARLPRDIDANDFS